MPDLEQQQPFTEQPQQPISEAQLRKLRGQYFTVRHIPLTDCGHKMDVINEPRHRNCSNCFWQWMNFHPQLVQTVDEAWREHGQAFVIKLRGRWFAKMFGRYMATVIAFKKQEEEQKVEQTNNARQPGENTAAESANESNMPS